MYHPMQMSLQMKSVEGEEKRKTMAHGEEQERRTAQYKTQLESELYQHKLEDQQKQNEGWLGWDREWRDCSSFFRQGGVGHGGDFNLEMERAKSPREIAAGVSP